MSEDENLRSPPAFDEWWSYAKQKGLVMGSEIRGHQLWIYDAQAKAMPFQQMLQLYPLESFGLENLMDARREKIQMPQKSLAMSPQPMDSSDMLAQIDIHFARLQWAITQIQ